MQRVYNFSPGPSMLPVSVLQKAADEMLCYQNTGMSVMEMSHRSNMYIEIYERSVSLLKQLMYIPDNYKVLFIQGGATMQFAAIPMNLGKNGRAAYIDSGNFASNAIKEAQKYLQVDVIASSKDANYTYVPEFSAESLLAEHDYLHITTNNTIFGTHYTKIPQTGAVPLVTDASSHILGEVLDVNQFGLIYAGAQKNIGPAGMAIIIIRDDLLDCANPLTPSVLNYGIMAKNDSMLNTPPTYGIYMAMLTFEWLLEFGGVAAMEKQNIYKAGLLYDFIDNSSLYKNPVVKEHRSIMNATFTTPTPELDNAFCVQAAKAGIENIKGHRLVGGMRASIYNAMPIEGIKALVEFMAKFEAENGGKA